MMPRMISTIEICAALQAIDDSAAGLPRRGDHIGDGIHVDLDDGSMAGWTLHAREIAVSEDGAVSYDLASTSPAGASNKDKETYESAIASAAKQNETIDGSTVGMEPTPDTGPYCDQGAR